MASQQATGRQDEAVWRAQGAETDDHAAGNHDGDPNAARFCSRCARAAERRTRRNS